MSDFVATVEKLYLYPVKSMAGIALEEAHVGLDGITGDREYAFVQADKADKSIFPWMTARENSRMLLYQPVLEQPPAAENSERTLRVKTPEGRLTEISDATLREEVAGGRRISLMRSFRAMTDCQHLSLFSLATVRALSRESESEIDHRQFRANFYVEPRSGQAFEEERWVNCLVRIGDRVLASVVQRDTRCMMINMDPETGVQNPKVLRAVAQQHGGDAGLYLTVVRPGVIHTGDPIRLIPLPD